MNKQHYQKLCKAIIAACPDIMELGFGCKFQEKDIFGKEYCKPVIYLYPNLLYGKSWSKKYRVVVVIDEDGKEFENYYMPKNKKEIKIVGRSIKIDDVLITLNKTAESRNYDAWLVSANGHFYKLELEIEETGISWEFNTPLSEQREETKQFLYNLLVKK